jgi:hypothetical protein
MGARVAGNLPVSVCSRASGASSGAAKELPDLQDAFCNHPVYPRICRPQVKLCLPALHVKGQRGDTNLCLKASYWCDLVGPRDSFETMVINLLELVPQPLSKQWR